MTRSTKFIAVFATLLALVPAAAAGAHEARSARQNEIEKEKAELKAKIAAAEAEAKDLQKRIGESDSRRADLERKIGAYSAQLSDAARRLEESSTALDRARDELVAAEASVAEATGRLSQIRGRLTIRSRSVYKLGPGGYIEMLLGAENFRSFVSRISYVTGVMRDDRARVSAVERLSQQLDAYRAEAEGRKADIARELAVIEAEKKRIASLRGAVSATRQEVLGEITQRKGLLSKVNAEKAEYLRQMKLLEAESRSIASLLRVRQKGQVFRSGNFDLAWPTTGPVSSRYGMRTHPVFGDRRMHAGIDIEAPAGQAVVAAEDGEVIFAGTKGGYGTTVIIDHGGALATLYAHLSKVSVTQGKKVERGATIGAVGCSGYCTGPHLHWETRVNGEPRDPLSLT